MRKLALALSVVVITVFHSQTLGEQNKWKVGIFNIKGFNKTSDILANSFKKSLSTLLSREFDIVDIPTSTLSRKNIVKDSINRNVNFSIYGFITETTLNNFTLVLQLVDITNMEVKLDKKYSIEYDGVDVEKVFNTIDNVTEDFKEGITKTIPKYKEELALEYVKKIEERKTEIDIPGNFYISLILNVHKVNDLDLVTLNNEISIKYINTTSGGIFRNGWFAGIKFFDPVFSIKLSTPANSINNLDFSVGNEISFFAGTEVANFSNIILGIGLNFLLVKGHVVFTPDYSNIYNTTLSFSLRPMLHLNYQSINILIIPTYLSPELRFLSFEKDLRIKDYLGINIVVNANVTEELSLEVVGEISSFNLDQGISPITLPGLDYKLGIGISKYFHF